MHLIQRSCATTCLALLAIAGAAQAQSPMFHFGGSVPGDGFGSALADAGDVDKDGVNDLVAASADAAGKPGYVKVLSGATGALLHTWIASASGRDFGRAVRGLGDVDGDLHGDVAVGAPLENGANGASCGVVRIYSGQTGAVIATLNGDAPGDHFGWSIASLGDVNGNGVRDLAVGAIDDDDGGSSSGTVRVFDGGTRATLYTLVGAGAQHVFGYSIAGIDDWNKDGASDLAVGAPGTTMLNQSGTVWVYSGATGALLHMFNGFGALDGFGYALADCGDVDGDLRRDLIVGAPQIGNGLTGYVRVYLANKASLLWDIAGDSSGDQFGIAVSGAGDVNQDGRGELLVGASGDDDGGSDSGSVRWLSGSSAQIVDTHHGVAAGQRFGCAVQGALDLNRDGVLDFAAGGHGGAATGGSVDVISTQALALVADTHEASFGAGALAKQQFALDATSTFGGMKYRILGSISGTWPGTPFGSLQVPLLRDRYFDYTGGAANGPIKNASGTLNAAGKGNAWFDASVLPSPPAWMGKTLYHAFVVMDANGVAVLASNAAPLTLLP